MQRESALHKKGITRFEQFWTNRNLLANALLKEGIQRLERKDSAVTRAMWLAFSSSLRYTNRMVTRNEGWRGNRPLEWVKPGFWLPPVYLEPNVWRQFAQRFEVILRTYRDERRRVSNPLVNARVSTDPAKLLNGSADCAIVTSSSTTIPLPDDSVSAVVTDPPYGNYVHYGDLTNFWTAWIWDGIGASSILDSDEEAVPARKPGYPGWKSFADYSRLMRTCFAECRRVLRPGGYLALTFNNREPRAWVALIAAVASAGFSLLPGGVYYQDGIQSYKHTAQSRREGSLIGDFVYTFRKGETGLGLKGGHLAGADFGQFLEGQLISAMREHLADTGSSDTTALFRSAYLAVQSNLFHYVQSKVLEDAGAYTKLISEAEKISTFDSTRSSDLRRFFTLDKGQWSLRALT